MQFSQYVSLVQSVYLLREAVEVYVSQKEVSSWVLGILFKLSLFILDKSAKLWRADL